MVKPIVRDTFFLSRRAEPVTRDDLPLCADLLDTLSANADRCVGMAANMIGVCKAAIVVHIEEEGVDAVMFQPVITKKSDPYETEEGCLSLSGTRPVTRWQTVTVEYRDAAWRKRRRTFTGFTAQIIQHECDHLAGILI